MANDNKAAVIAAIWQNPERLFNHPFRQTSGAWEIMGGNGHQKGEIRLTMTTTGTNIYVHGNTGSGIAGQHIDVFTYAERYALNTAGFKETLHRLAELYNIKIEYSEETARKMSREMIAREVCPCLIESLRKNPTGAAGKYITETRGLSIDAHFGELTADSLNRAKEHLRNRGISYTVEDFKALGLTEDYARYGYNVVMPNYHNGQVNGFIFRNTNPNVAKKDRLRASGGMTRVYCDRLTIGAPVYVVEGEMDAINLIQAGFTNVIAMGGASNAETLGRLLRANGINRVTYVPDVEYNEDGTRDLTKITAALNAFHTIQVDGERVITHLHVSEFETPDGVSLNGYKADVNSYAIENGNDALAVAVEMNETYWYDYELRQLREWAATATGWNVGELFRDRFSAIYKRCDAFEREAIKRAIKGVSLYEQHDVTPSALDSIDKWGEQRDYNNRIAAAYTDMGKAIEDGANPVVIADVINRFVEAQATNSADEWNRQLNESFADELDAIKEQPEPLRTKWELGVIRKNNPTPYRKTEHIEYYPADITVFCAPTSHGKTMILFQSALDMVQANPSKTFLYVSCEETKPQLLERALKTYIPIPNTESGKDESGNYCFLSKTRRKTIKAVIREDIPPYEYSPYMNTSEHYSALEPLIKGYIKQYGEQVRPRLRLLHTNASTESICSNVMRYVREAQEQGEQVGAVFVDYMQLLSTDSKQYSRHDELKTICKALHDCAGVIGLPIIIAAQLNREVLRNGIDDITVANIGEGADIERIAHDVFLVWQVDKTALGLYVDKGKEIDANVMETKRNTTIVVNPKNVGIRANRIFTSGMLSNPNQRTLKAGYLYVEHLKARDGETDGWGLFPYDGESGRIGENDKVKMAE